MKFLVGFLAYVFIELMLLLWLATVIGWLAVFGITVAGFLLGLLVIRDASFNAAQLMNDANGGRQIPADRVSDIGLKFLAGILILIPGLVTDVIGLGLLIPYVRKLARGWGARAFARWARTRNMSVVTTTVDGVTVTRVVPGDVVAGDVIKRTTSDDDPNPPIRGQIEP